MKSVPPVADSFVGNMTDMITKTYLVLAEGSVEAQGQSVLEPKSCQNNDTSLWSFLYLYGKGQNLC